MENMNMFDSYKEDFIELMNEAREKLQKFNTTTGMNRQRIFLEVNRHLGEAQDVIPLLRFSARSLGAENLELVNGYELALQKLKEELKSAENFAEEDDRARLFGRRNELEHDELNDTREMVAQRKMQESINILQEAERNVDISINSGAGTLVELGRQKEIIKGSRQALSNINSKLSKAKSVMNDIWTKTTKTSIIKGVIIIVLVIACIFVIYFRYIWSPDPGNRASGPAVNPVPPVESPISPPPVTPGGEMTKVER